MKQLKKNPLVQRMEDMTFPIFKPGKCFYHPKEPAVLQSGTAEYNLCQKCLDKSLSNVTMTGREYLRSINDDNGFTLMPRIVWRLVAVVILVIICLVIIL